MYRELTKYIGQTVTIIYTDRQSGFSKRRIKILSVDDRTLRAFCLDRRAPRTFLIASILAMEPSLSRKNVSSHQARASARA
jgi:predicted DNA-binding transcriptional regulator YafY